MAEFRFYKQDKLPETINNIFTDGTMAELKDEYNDMICVEDSYGLIIKTKNLNLPVRISDENGVVASYQPKKEDEHSFRYKFNVLYSATYRYTLDNVDKTWNTDSYDDSKWNHKRCGFDR